MSEIASHTTANRPARNYLDFLQALARPEAFPDTVRGPITIMQTHASAVLLTDDHAYKLKKPKDFGFFDYSTPALRRHFCQEEVRLNARLAPDVYLGVAPVITEADGQVRFGPTLMPDQAPEPGAPLESGQVVDYAVVMVRLPNEAMLEAQVQNGTATAQQFAEAAELLATFHASVPTNEHIASFGDLAVISNNWEENFTQTLPYVGQMLDTASYQQIATSVRRFLQERSPLFDSRKRAGRIRDCHGDLRLQHIYTLGQRTNEKHRLAVIDCIEFNERFRYGDVAGEVAFLTMELDASGRPDLARAFVNTYVRVSGDESLRELLPFYACYRAYVRGKVAAFQSDEPEVPEKQRETAKQQAQTLFGQASHYARGLTSPLLVLVGGLMGTGKSSLAEKLHHNVGWALFSSDVIRKQLAGKQPPQTQTASFGEGLYSKDWTALTYQTLLEKAEFALANGRSVLLDATFLRRAHRQAAAQLAATCGAQAIFLECVCPPEIALQRLAHRWATRVAQGLQEASQASDGRPDLYEQQRATWEDYQKEQEPGLEHLPVETSGAIAPSVEQVLEVFRIPHFACWF